MIFNKTNLLSLVLFLLVLLINILVRSEVLVYETLLADDLIYLPLALVDACIIPARHPIDFNFICHVVGAKSVFIGRGLFLAYIALTATILFITLTSFRLNRFLAFLVSVSIFAGIPFLSQGTFITGSYPSHGLFFITLALYLTSRCLTHRDDSNVTLLCYLGIFLLFILAGIAATSLTLCSFIIAPCALYAFIKKRNFILWTLISIIPGLSFTLLQFTGLFSNHYKGLSGWITFSPEQLVSKIAEHVTSMGIIVCCLLAAVLVITTILYITHSWKLFVNRHITEYPPVTPSSNELLIILIGILLIGFTVSLLPTLFVQGILPRYTTAPLFFIFCLTFILLQFVKSQFQNQYIKFGIAVAALAFTTTSIITFGQKHYALYHKLSVDQQEVSSLLRKKSTLFAKNAQILVFFDDNHTNFTGGLNHWSTHFARMATGRTDITAVIGSKSGMNNDPFTGEYSDHGKQYWVTRNGRAQRKKMVGLDKNRPTYILSLENQKNKTYDCIAIFQANNLSIYNVDESGIKIKYQRTPQHTENGDPPSMSSCIYYVLGTDQLPAGDVPKGLARVFEGSKSEIITPASHASPLPYSIGFSFKSISTEIQSGYTDTTPPMPILALPLSIYQITENDFRIGIACKEQSMFSFRSVSDWTKISFEVDMDGKGILMVNNTVVQFIDDCSAPSKITLGQGFNNRFWKGIISDFEYRNNSQLIN